MDGFVASVVIAALAIIALGGVYANAELVGTYQKGGR
jgi:hypothetical protein